MHSQTRSLLISFTLIALSGKSYSQNLNQELLEQQKRIPHKISKQEANALMKGLKSSLTSKHFNHTKEQMFSKDGSLKKTDSQNTTLYFGDFCSSDEDTYISIEQSLINDWRASWESKDFKKFASLWSKDGLMTSFQSKKSEVKKIGNIESVDWQLADQLTEISKEKDNLEKYLSSFTKIEELRLTTKEYSVPQKSRSKDFRSTSKMILKIHYDLRGFTENNIRREDRGILGVELEKIGKNWKISAMQIEKMNTMTNATPAFSEMTLMSGMKDLKQYQRLEAIRRGGYALAVGDYNNDGIPDIYTGAYGPGQLFKGAKDSSFSEVSASGIENHRYVKSAIWADFNNDGLEDLLLVRFVPFKEENLSGGRSDIIIYKNLGDRFVKTGFIEEDAVTGYAMPATIADFNGDGLMDIYVGFPGSKDFTSGPTNSIADKLKEGTKAQGVYLNSGDFKFKTHRMAEFNYNSFETFNTLQRVFPHSAVAVDLNRDGAPDIMVVDDRDNLSPLYMNNGKGKFTQGAEQIGVTNSGYGMGLAIDDYNNDGLIDVLASGVSFNSAARISNSCLMNWDTDMRVESHFQKNSKTPLRYFSGALTDGKVLFTDKTPMISRDDLGDGLAGMESIDYDNDGFSDVYVANGLWSGTDKTQDISSLISRSTNFSGNSSMVREGMNKTQSRVMELLSNFKGDIFSKGKNERPSLGGFQRNKLFKNRGDGSFVEVGFLEGVDSIADGYVISRADINNDGFSDLILRNADPGTVENTFPSIQIYLNKGSKYKSVRLKLIGQLSNKNAVGAVVEAKINSKLIQTKQLLGNNGTAQSEKIIHFGLGDNDEAAEINIKWPSGQTTQLKNVKAGFHTITEKADGMKISAK